ncbi:MAG: two-component regulator propeller domain-containing protein [Saprospiraceae bacterium]
MNIKRTIYIRWTCLGLIQLLVSVVFFITAYSQLSTNNLTRYSELDGVPALQVDQVLVDRQGYIWTGTINGLAKFDGYTFKRFFNNPNDPGSIKGLQVWSLFEDRTGQIWVATSPTNLNVYDPVTKSFSTYGYEHLIEHPATVELGVSSMIQDHNGRIYFGISSNFGEAISSGLLYKDENESELHLFPSPDSMAPQNVVSLHCDQAGNIWINTYGGILKIDTAYHITKFNNLDAVLKNLDDRPVRVISGEQGHIWILTAKVNLFDFDLSLGSYKMYTPEKPHLDQHRNIFTSDGKDHLWIGTTHDLSRFNIKTKKFELFDFGPQHPLYGNQILDLKLDEFGNIWIGTQAQGLYKYEEKAIFRSYSYNKEQKNSLTQGWVNNIYESRDGKLYITSGGLPLTAGLNILDAEAKTILPIPYVKLNTEGIFSFIEHDPNEFYFGTYPGIFIFSAVDQKVRKTQVEGLPTDAVVFKFFRDQKNNLWLGTNKGLFRKENNRVIKYDLSILAGSNASSNEITGIYESMKHGLWLLTNNGLFLYRYAVDKIERYGFDSKLGDVFITQDINSFYEDSAGIAWVGTWQGGLNRYNVEKRTVKTYTMDDGLPSMSIQSILADEKRNSLWLSTFEGLSRLNIIEGKFYNYSISDGIQGQLFADGAGLKTSKGLFIFGGSNGITVFNPSQVNNGTNPPKVFLTDFKLFNKSILPGENSILKKPIQETDEVILKSNENNISLEFAVIHYSDPAKNKSEYRLEGYENEWRSAGQEHFAFYPKLAPGQYLFRVKAANNNGIWNEKGIKLKITILQPWWNTNWAYLLYFLILIVLGLALNRYMRKRIIKKQQEEFQIKQLEQAKIIEKAYQELGQTHETLKATQAQLIQSEKMASLGELSAGIAHEIQNPLNFVNNFSEVNNELIEELKEELAIGNGQQAIEIADTIKENGEKINHHGKRADAIVKGMLQHSQKSSVQKESTDINALCDEYLRLSYHGLRAKDPSFNATMKTDFDESIGNINIIPQDIGRVVLNLINNAFYAVNERNVEMVKRISDEVYEPTVSVSTKKISDKVEIKVTDNGNGIPQKIVDKIFQPFFTTKPTGQGTGLGLSLSYDIVKAHGGTISVESKESEGSSFLINLPLH